MIEDPRISAYIDRAAPFAQPILTRLRAAVRAACPNVEETIKWSMPNFGYHGRILCNMAAFKQHATFGFWQGSRITGDGPGSDEKSAMGQFGRLTSIADLPGDDVLSDMILKAMALIDDARPAARPIKHPKPPAIIQDDFAAALKAIPPALTTFDAFPPGQRREYIDWVEEAKRPETRQKRINQAVEWLAEGKRRNWKYENC
jgi:uncharacterized protein YdeI (YjbR/CyaY-like superfamily)